MDPIPKRKQVSLKYKFTSVVIRFNWPPECHTHHQNVSPCVVDTIVCH